MNKLAAEKLATEYYVLGVQMALNKAGMTKAAQIVPRLIGTTVGVGTLGHLTSSGLARRAAAKAAATAKAEAAAAAAAERNPWLEDAVMQASGTAQAGLESIPGRLASGFQEAMARAQAQAQQGIIQQGIMAKDLAAGMSQPPLMSHEIAAGMGALLK